MTIDHAFYAHLGITPLSGITFVNVNSLILVIGDVTDFSDCNKLQCFVSSSAFQNGVIVYIPESAPMWEMCCVIAKLL